MMVLTRLTDLAFFSGVAYADGPSSLLDEKLRLVRSVSSAAGTATMVSLTLGIEGLLNLNVIGLGATADGSDDDALFDGVSRVCLD